MRWGMVALVVGIFMLGYTLAQWARGRKSARSAMAGLLVAIGLLVIGYAVDATPGWRLLEFVGTIILGTGVILEIRSTRTR